MSKFIDKLWIVAVATVALFQPQIGRAEEPPPFLLKFGTYGSGDREFNGPIGLAVDASGNVYVADTYNHRIQKFTSTGEFLTKWGSEGTGDGEFQYCSDVALDVSGNVYVADTWNHRIQKFTSSGGYIMQWGTFGSGDSQFINPWSVAVDVSGNVYIFDHRNHRIQKFTSTGRFLTKWGSEGIGEGEFSGPVGLAVDASGNVYVADTWNHRIQKFTSTGEFLTKWGTKWGTRGIGDGEFDGLLGVAVDVSGNVYVADTGNDRIQKFTNTGGFLTKWGSEGIGDGEFQHPVGVALDVSGNVYVTDYWNYRIQKFGPSPSVGVEPDVSQPQVSLAQPMPNPWSRETILRFTLARESRVALAVYDLAGRRLKQWSWPSLSAGPHQVTWDGETEDGRLTAPGTLFYRLETGGQVLNRKMVRLQ